MGEVHISFEASIYSASDFPVQSDNLSSTDDEEEPTVSLMLVLGL